MDSIDSETVDNGVALHVDDVPWAKQQMWAPDAMKKTGIITFFSSQRLRRDFSNWSSYQQFQQVHLRL